MRIVITQPPYYAFEGQSFPHYAFSDPPLGLGDLAAYIRHYGYKDIEIRDFYMTRWEAIEKYLERFKDCGRQFVMGASCCSDTRHSSYRMARLAKKVVPKKYMSQVVIYKGTKENEFAWYYGPNGKRLSHLKEVKE